MRQNIIWLQNCRFSIGEYSCNPLNTPGSKKRPFSLYFIFQMKNVSHLFFFILCSVSSSLTIPCFPKLLHCLAVIYQGFFPREILTLSASIFSVVFLLYR